MELGFHSRLFPESKFERSAAMQRQHSVLEAVVRTPDEERARYEKWLEERKKRGFIDVPTGPNRKQRRARMSAYGTATPEKPCPCGSGLTFGACHLKAGWEAYKAGQITLPQPVAVLSEDARREARNKRKAARRAGRRS